MTASLAKRLLIWLAPVALCLGVAHLGFQIVKHWDVVTLDFRFFWLAGEFWSAGDNPYDAAFAEAAASTFGITKGAIWYYTPNWFFIAGLLSLFDPLTASRFWLIINTGLLLGASALNVAAYRAMAGRTSLIISKAPFTELLRSLPPVVLFGLHAGFMGVAQAVGNSLHLGQSSMVIYFGASLLVFAAATKRNITGAAGLALLMLKPQIGLLLVPALALSPFGRRVLALGALATFLLSVPALLMTPAPEMIAGLITGAAQYNDQHYNLAGAMTGLRHLVWSLGLRELGAAFYYLLALAAVCAICLAGRRRKPALRIVDMIMASFAAALLIAPLHVYDFTLMGVLVLFCACLRPPAGAISIAAFLVMWRAGNLPQPAALEQAAAVYYPGSLYVTAAIAAICIALLWAAAPRASVNPKRSPTPPKAAAATAQG